MKNQQNNFSEIGSIVINFLRPDITIKCLESLKEQAPGINIYVGDQDNDNQQLKAYCEENDINYVKLPFDCGIGVARNELVKSAKKDKCKYIMWGDNDFVYDERLRLQNALTVLTKNKRIGIVGGTVLKNNIVQHYERIIYYNKFYKTACFIPLEYTYPKTYYTDGIDYYYCDMTFNFCLAKIEIFTNEVKWDEDIKVKFEHSFFFLKYLKHSKYRVAYCPSMMVKHEHGKDEVYHQYRYRVNDGEIYAKKLDLKTGFAVNERSWNHVTQSFMDYRRVASESPTLTSALKYNIVRGNVIKQAKKQSLNPFKNVFELLEHLKSKNIPFVLLRKTCLEAVKKHDLNYGLKELCLGCKDVDAFQGELLQMGCVQEDKVFKYEDYKIVVEYYNAMSKKFDVNQMIVDVPYPVLNYLTKTFGRKWEQIDV